MSVVVGIPGYGRIDGTGPIVILGPNGSGKTKLAQLIVRDGSVTAVSAQRRTWVDDSLPVQEEVQMKAAVQAQQNQWQDRSWQPTEEINHLLSTLIQDHTSQLTKRNADAIAANTLLEPVRGTRLMSLQSLWTRLFPKRRLEIGGFFPKVSRLDKDPEVQYRLREMSDGERTVLYMAARVLTSDKPVVLVDEPELHMHSKLAIRFWDEAERLRPDCRYVYITHDLAFTLSRRNAVVLITKEDGTVREMNLADVPSSVAADVLGAATLPFYAKRIVLYEGEPNKGFASAFLTAWFKDDQTFALPAGNRDAVLAAVCGLSAVGLTGAELIGLVDRDYYSDEALDRTPAGVQVLQLHELESVLCASTVVKALSRHLKRSPDADWGAFLSRVRAEYTGQTLSSLVARRVRAQATDLLNGAFAGGQFGADVGATATLHSNAIEALGLPTRLAELFVIEHDRIAEALASGDNRFLQLLPGKHLAKILPPFLGLADFDAMSKLVLAALGHSSDQGESADGLGAELETALAPYLPSRMAPNS